MLVITQFIATLAATLFAGAAIYINLVEHPARLSCSTELAATVWAPSYQRAAIMQASLAIISTVFGVAAWWFGAGILWLVGTACIFAVIPVTFIMIFPTNRRLLEPARDLTSSETRSLLIKWGHLHGVRSVLSLVSAVIFIATLVGK